MLRSIFTKTLYERRISTAIWCATMVGFIILIMLLFPSLRDSLGASLQDVPESMAKLLGNADDYQTITGYVDLQVIAQMIFLTIIMAIIIGSSLIAGDESKGSLQSLLIQPVSRTQVFLQKLAALKVITFIVAGVGTFLGVAIGALILGESIDYGMLALSSIMVWLVTLFFAAMAYGIGAATGNRGLAGVIAGFYAFVGYMLTALSGIAPSLETLNTLSIFNYFNTPSVLRYGLDVGNIIVLVAGMSVFLVYGYVRFKSRDIPL